MLRSTTPDVQINITTRSRLHLLIQPYRIHAQGTPLSLTRCFREHIHHRTLHDHNRALKHLILESLLPILTRNSHPSDTRAYRRRTIATVTTMRPKFFSGTSCLCSRVGRVPPQNLVNAPEIHAPVTVTVRSALNFRLHYAVNCPRTSISTAYIM
jgi:hypothetical protein